MVYIHMVGCIYISSSSEGNTIIYLGNNGIIKSFEKFRDSIPRKTDNDKMISHHVISVA